MCDEQSYEPPAPSRATRTFPARSKSSVRGFLFAKLPGQEKIRQIIYESALERRVLLTLLARPDVVDIWDQPPAIPYKTAEGRSRHHTPDFLVTYRSGHREAIAVKPRLAAERGGFQAELAAIRSTLSPAYADDLRLVTEADLNDADVRNAELLHIARQAEDAEARRIIGDLLSELAVERRAGDIIDASGLAGRGWAALLRAIFEGEAIIAPRRRFTLDSLVHPRGAR